MQARPLTIAMLGALAAGLAAGTIVPPRMAAWLEPVGVLWFQALKASVMPLVIPLLIASVCRVADLRDLGRLGGIALAWAVGMLAAGAGAAALVMPLLLRGVEPNAALIAQAKAPAPVAMNWVSMIMPGNLAQAAAEGSLLPLLVFAILFGAALTRLSDGQREPIERLLRAVADAMLIVVGWLLAVAPVGIFALALGLAAKTGVGGAGALGIYVASFCGLLMGLILALYGLAAVFSPVPMAKFVRALLPAQAVAVSSRSSMAALPALLEASKNNLRLPEPVTGFVLPMAVALFRFLAPAGQVAGALFVARLYGIELGPEQMGTLIATSVLLSFTAPGIPSSGILVALPLFTQLGLPGEGIGLLVALDLIPDMLKTPGNVTAHMTLAAIVSKRLSVRRAPDV